MVQRVDDGLQGLGVIIRDVQLLSRNSTAALKPLSGFQERHPDRRRRRRHVPSPQP
jgi:hypothetical protein